MKVGSGIDAFISGTIPEGGSRILPAHPVAYPDSVLLSKFWQFPGFYNNDVTLMSGKNFTGQLWFRDRLYVYAQDRESQLLKPYFF